MTTPKSALLPGEQVLDSWLANHAQHSHRAVGGRLHLTDQRLLFEPNTFDELFEGRTWHASLPAIAELRRTGLDPLRFLGGGLRRRLAVRLYDGREALFVVNRVPERIAAIEAAARAAGGAPA